MGLFGKKLNYTEKCIGVINGVSAVKVNNMHLPLVEYVVDGETYKVRMPHEMAVVMESEQNGKSEIVRANLNFGTSVKAQMTSIQGRKVQVAYDPEKPQKGKVIGYENEEWR